MATVKRSFRRAVAAHREALGLLHLGRGLLERLPSEPLYGAQSLVRQAEIVRRLGQVTDGLPSGWGISGWDRLHGGPFPLGEGSPQQVGSLVRIGTAAPVEDSFPVLLPFLGSNHLVVDTDARDPRVAALVRGVLLRCLAAAAPGSLRVLAIDAVTLGVTFSPFSALVGVELMTAPGADTDTLRHALAAAEEHVRWSQTVPEHDRSSVILAIAGLPSGWTRDDLTRLASLAHAGGGSGIQLLVAGYPPASPGGAGAPPLEGAVPITVLPDEVRVGNIPGTPLGARDRGLNCPVLLDPAPPQDLAEAVCATIAERAGRDTQVGFAQLVAPELWTESSVDGLRTVVGRAGRDPVWLSLNDVAPHWLVGGRTGSGKTVFLLGVLYGLASRYSPDELALYLLDFKEGVSFTEFTPTEMDPTWIPHARTVGVESDREYGVAVLAALSAEMNRRATAMKQAGATKLAQLRQARPDVGLPRIVAVIDEFHVLFAGNDRIARRAGELLEDIARKGRSYGIHLILASQTTSGIEALFAKGEAIFGQFSQRIALAGGRGALALLNDAADALPVGEAIVNDSAGVPAANRRIRFPDTDPGAVQRVRTRLWERRMPGDAPPAVFAGYALQHLDDDPTWLRLDPHARRRSVLVGRTVDVGLPTAAFTLDASPGRHLAVLGTSEIGADLLHAAVLGLARQHAPGRAEFVLAGLVAAADDAADAAAEAVRAAGHRCSEVELTGLRDALARLARPSAGSPGDLDAQVAALSAADGPAAGAGAPEATYVVVWGADTAGAALRAARDPATDRTGLEDLRTVLQEGPARSVHVIGWWRVLRRFTDDLGSSGKDDVAGLVALNVTAKDLGNLLGNYTLEWQPRPNRALFIDQHEDRSTLVVPFVRGGTLDGGVQP